MKFPEYLRPYIDNKEDLKAVSESIYGFATSIEEQQEDALKKKYTLLLFSGPSGAGKSVIMDELMKRDKRFGRIKTYTTRPRRPNEIFATQEETDEKDSYVRVNKEIIDKAIAEGDAIEFENYPGGTYCSLRSAFESGFKTYELPILCLEPRGSKKYKNLWRDGSSFFEKANLIYIFIVPSSKSEIDARLISRPGEISEALKRIDQFPLDIPFVNDAEYIVINEDGKLENCVEELREILK